MGIENIWAVPAPSDHLRHAKSHSDMLNQLRLRTRSAAYPTTSNQRSFDPVQRKSQVLSKLPELRMGFAVDKSAPYQHSHNVNLTKRQLPMTSADHLGLTSVGDTRLEESPGHSEEPPERSRTVNLNSFDQQGSKKSTPLYKITAKMLGCDGDDFQPWSYFELHVNHSRRRHARLLQKSLDEEPMTRRSFQSLEAQPVDGEIDFLAGEPAFNPNSIPINNPFSNEDGGFESSDSQSNPLSRTPNSKSAGVTPAPPPTAANSLGFSIESNDLGYFAEIQVGTPPKPFKVIVDSGSSDFWLSAPQCRNSNTGAPSCAHASLSTQSTSLKMSDTPFKVAYGTGQVSGVLVQENVEVAGLKLPGHTFGGATTESNEFAAANVPFDGLMGTAGSSLSNQNLLTPIETLAKGGAVPGAFMGYALGRAGDENNIGQVTFGGVDQTKFEGALTLFDNISTLGFWEGHLSHVTVDGRVVLSHRTAILDTGTSLMMIPQADAAAIHREIRGSRLDPQAGGYIVPCNMKSSVALRLGGKEFRIKPSDIAFQPLDGLQKNGDCISGIGVGNVGGQNQWLVGDVFLKNVYFATDATNNQIGLAQIKASE